MELPAFLIDALKLFLPALLAVTTLLFAGIAAYSRQGFEEDKEQQEVEGSLVVEDSK